MSPPRSGVPLERSDGDAGEGIDWSELGALGRYRDRLRELIRQHPTSSVLAALVAGYLVGRLIRA